MTTSADFAFSSSSFGSQSPYGCTSDCCYDKHSYSDNVISECSDDDLNQSPSSSPSKGQRMLFASLVLVANNKNEACIASPKMDLRRNLLQQQTFNKMQALYNATTSNEAAEILFATPVDDL